jgi:hypothetical protein
MASASAADLESLAYVGTVEEGREPRCRDQPALLLHELAAAPQEPRQSVRSDPAMAAALSDHIWTYGEIAALLD